MDLTTLAFDTSAVMTVGGLIIGAYGGIWGVKRVIGMVSK